MTKHIPIIDQIRQRLKDRGWTQQQLADASGVPRARISRILSGHRPQTTVETADKLLAALREQP